MRPPSHFHYQWVRKFSQSATIRDNILFGTQYDEERYQSVVRDCCLLPDFEAFSFVYCPSVAISTCADDRIRNGDLTEVGEKGVSLSGGQKQRINIARALYHNCDITFFDDSFSALDVHVSEVVFQNVLRKALGSKTCILVTHSLQLLPRVDYIITIADGKVNERGTYAELIASGGPFSKFVTEFVTEPEDSPNGAPASDVSSEETLNRGGGLPSASERETPGPRPQQSAGPAIMQDEERFRGGVGWRSLLLSELSVFFAHVDIFHSLPGLSGHSSHEDRCPHVHRGGRRLPRIQYYEPILVNIFYAFFPPLELTRLDRLVLWQQDNLNLSRGTYVGLALV